MNNVTTTPRETTFEECATWGECPVCHAPDGEWCYPETGIHLGAPISGKVKQGDGVHLARMQRAPKTVRVVGSNVPLRDAGGGGVMLTEEQIQEIEVSAKSLRSWCVAIDDKYAVEMLNQAMSVQRVIEHSRALTAERDALRARAEALRDEVESLRELFDEPEQDVDVIDGREVVVSERYIIDAEDYEEIEKAGGGQG